MPARSSRFAFVVLVLVSVAWLSACGDESPPAVDAAADSSIGEIDAPTGDIDAPAAPSCTDYCTTIAANCAAANLMYASTGECMATCGRFTPGTVGMMSGNTAGCRLYHAGAAAGSVGNANTHCRHGGPGGDGLCGSNCEGFCTIVLGSCTAKFEQYGGNMSTCMTACAGFATTPPYVANATGNTFACRLYHATAAAANPGTHCGHTSAGGGGVCVGEL
jgi:hypothetical protein